MKITRSSFDLATKGQFNSIREWNGLHIARVGWHDKTWKLVTPDCTFDEVAERSYSPIASFYLRDELWAYIKTLI